MSGFLILGLPRSRTAWLANFMTYGNIFCFHEAINGCHSMEEYIDKIKGVGDSNTAIALYEFERFLPEDTKLIIIDSSIDNAVEFGKSFGHDIKYAMGIAKERLDSFDGLHVHIDDINDNLEEIWNYVTDEEFNKERADMLIGLDVQIRDVYSIDEESMIKFTENTNDYFT